MTDQNNRPPFPSDTDSPHDGDTLDRAVRELRDEAPAADEIAAARARTWERISAAAAEGDSGCAPIAADIDAHVGGRLSDERSALVRDHLRECLPCRRRYRALTGAGSRAAAIPPRAARSPRRWSVHVFAAAAVLAAAAAALFALRPGGDPLGDVRVAHLEGILLDSTNGSTTTVGVGASVEPGRIVRTGRGSRATLALADGSLVEMNERSELAITGRGDETTVRLTRGDVIVTAARRPVRNLFVQTDELTVAVKGTIFTVGHGLRGSRVGVLEGSVEVADGSSRRLLAPGDQATSREELAPADLAEQVRWSQQADAYLALLQELDRELLAVAESLEREPLPRNVRHSSELLDAMPRETVLFAAVPNSPANLARVSDMVRERIATNPTLARWWSELEREAEAQGEPTMAELLDFVQRTSDSLGDEVVVALVLRPDEGGVVEPSPVIVSALRDAAALSDALDGGLVEHLRRQGAQLPPVIGALELKAQAAVAAADEARLVVGDGHVLAGGSAPILAGVLDRLEGREPSSIAGSELHRTLSEHYRRGTEALFAVDLERIVGTALATATPRTERGRDDLERTLELFDLSNMQNFVVASGESTGEGRAVLSFRETRGGVASWLAAPAPMGSLDFVSGDASAVLAVVVKDPESMLRDVERAVDSQSFAEGLARFREETGLDLARDVAGTLGGELAIAVDGPLLPEPSWKLVAEVYDPVRLQQSIELLVGRANAWLAEEAVRSGEDTVQVALESRETGEGPSWRLAVPGLPTEVHYAFRNGYLVATPNRSLLETALQLRRRGATLASSAGLQELLPPDSDQDVSLLAYQDFGASLGPLFSAALGGGQATIDGSQAHSATGFLVQGRAGDRDIELTLRSASGGPGAQLAGLLRHAALRTLMQHAAAGELAVPSHAAGMRYDDASGDDGDVE